jgi:hypothetical protein
MKEGRRGGGELWRARVCWLGDGSVGQTVLCSFLVFLFLVFCLSCEWKQNDWGGVGGGRAPLGARILSTQS